MQRDVSPLFLRAHAQLLHHRIGKRSVDGDVDAPERLDALLDCLAKVSETYGKPILVSTHPRTRKRLDTLGRTLEGVTFHPPLGFLDYNKLQLNAACVLSDSGTIAEESSLLGFPAVTLRDAIERPEALDTGAILMTGLDPENVLEAMGLAMRGEPVVVPDDYQIGNCSQRVVDFIVSTVRRHKQWSGLR